MPRCCVKREGNKRVLGWRKKEKCSGTVGRRLCWWTALEIEEKGVVTLLKWKSWRAIRRSLELRGRADLIKSLVENFSVNVLKGRLLLLEFLKYAWKKMIGRWRRNGKTREAAFCEQEFAWTVPFVSKSGIWQLWDKRKLPRVASFLQTLPHLQTRKLACRKRRREADTSCSVSEFWAKQ